MTDLAPAQNDTYKMTVELSVLESLGINLYSNAAAVLSELVANAYDADAGEVSITWQARAGDATGTPTEVVITDDGRGMTQAQLNKQFLTAGYKKRDEEGTASPKWQRPYMGRKGIGKLSVFSLARVVEVYSAVADGTPNGFRIVVSDLEAAIRTPNTPYYPQPIPVPSNYAQKGTTLVLSDLKSKRAGLTAAALRKRLARRFDVLDDRAPDAGGFHITVNGKRITWQDRQELKRLQFIWEFGSRTIPAKALPNDIQRFLLPRTFVDEDRGWRIRGWIGTTRTPTDLVDDQEAGSLKNIIVLARKRPIQEGIIEKLDFSRLFGNYVTGQIEADFLDLDDPEYDDIATSDRQRLIEDDERVVKLQEFLRSAFVTAAEQWTKARATKEGKSALEDYPKLEAWVEQLDEYQKPAARKMIGTIAGLSFEKRDETASRNDLFRSGVLAFARVGLRKNAEQLELLSNVTAEDLLPLLGQQDTYEAGLWIDILRSRVEAIARMQDLTDANEKEKVLQQHLFDHLWLLDASWERATTEPQMEEDLRKIEPGLFAKDSDDEEIKGRIDIRYATVGGRHVIVELKRYDRKVEADELNAQGVRYANALASILHQQQRGDEAQKIEVVFVLGQEPGTKGKGPTQSVAEYQASALRPSNGSFRLYDALIRQARNQYQQYLDASAKARALDELLDALAPNPVESKSADDEEAPTLS
ncbi:ATP-binding protein [Curtobacterium sp. MCBD17_028]|uniref:BbrUII/HgiDII family restriction enzyme n=1 Tax=Curtobacterium sp. MCBD17_028 TaxID=2175670 RepID=UPI000DA93132|nr:ATP-binding protein [Curtobacterium sp. MCBD17_028]PZE26109.1 ATP-binding protein [Curtobacterium sp. MCBD17_028]